MSTAENARGFAIGIVVTATSQSVYWLGGIRDIGLLVAVMGPAWLTTARLLSPKARQAAGSGEFIGMCLLLILVGLGMTWAEHHISVLIR